MIITPDSRNQTISFSCASGEIEMDLTILSGTDYFRFLKTFIRGQLSLGSGIKMVREHLLKLTQQELADKIGVTVVSVSKWENCHAIPSDESKEAIIALVIKESKHENEDGQNEHQTA